MMQVLVGVGNGGRRMKRTETECVHLPFSLCRVYDSKSGVQVQSYTGHQDSIKGLIHVPEMEQVQRTGTSPLRKRKGDVGSFFLS